MLSIFIFNALAEILENMRNDMKCGKCDVCVSTGLESGIQHIIPLKLSQLIEDQVMMRTVVDIGVLYYSLCLMLFAGQQEWNPVKTSTVTQVYSLLEDSSHAEVVKELG